MRVFEVPFIGRDITIYTNPHCVPFHKGRTRMGEIEINLLWWEFVIGPAERLT